MPTTNIKEYSYKGFPIEINFATGNDLGDYNNKFYVKNSLPFHILANKNIEELEADIKNGFDQWLSTQPKTDRDWVELITSCIIQDGYEDWHVDECRVINIMNRYVNFKRDYEPISKI